MHFSLCDNDISKSISLMCFQIRLYGDDGRITDISTFGDIDSILYCILYLVSTIFPNVFHLLLSHLNIPYFQVLFYTAMEVNLNATSTPSSGPDSHTERFAYYYGTYDVCCRTFIWNITVLIFVTLCLKSNFARIIYTVICVAWQYQLSKTSAIFSTMIILSLSW